MATIQQSIDIKVPVHAAYSQLTRFEDYPRFMEEVETVQQLDDTHLHWTTIMANRPVEWDAEITEQETDRCIAWHNTSGPTNIGKVELQPLDADASRVTFTLRTEPEQVPGSMAGNHEDEMAHQLELDLAHLKEFIEAGGAGARATQGDSGSPGYAAGSEGWSGDEDPGAPVTSSTRASTGTAAEQRNDSAGSVSSKQSQAPRSAQADSMRHVGQMPQDMSMEHQGESPASDAAGKSMLQDGHDKEDEAKLKQSMDRSVPPSE
jgi:hypothetical protein